MTATVDWPDASVEYVLVSYDTRAPGMGTSDALVCTRTVRVTDGVAGMDSAIGRDVGAVSKRAQPEIAAIRPRQASRNATPGLRSDEERPLRAGIRRDPTATGLP